ncbi:MAG: hypothetical protein GF334_07540 [Candidatus Altiarchaeales archaeon]|nr:hypothetical protein [Candidatus Altiarchaeales archaeon]
MIDEDGTEVFSRIWDYREDPEGILFTKEIIESDEAKTKARYIKDLFKEKIQTRFLTGFCDKSGIQRVSGVDDEDLSG